MRTEIVAIGQYVRDLRGTAAYVVCCGRLDLQDPGEGRFMSAAVSYFKHGRFAFIPRNGDPWLVLVSASGITVSSSALQSTCRSTCFSALCLRCRAAGVRQFSIAIPLLIAQYCSCSCLLHLYSTRPASARAQAWRLSANTGYYEETTKLTRR